MKKNKFLLAAMTAAAVLFASCSKEAGTEGNGNGDDIAGNTYATFKFNRPTLTRGVFDPSAIAANDVLDSKWDYTDLRLVIFDNTTKNCEYNQKVNNLGEATVLLTTGTKKIFVFANTAKLKNTVGGSLSDFDTEIVTFTKNGAKTLNDFYALAFDAGTPQHYLTDAARAAAETNPGRTFSYAAFSTRINDVDRGIPASNDNGIDYKLKAGVTSAQASGGTFVTEGESPTNSFNIQLKYMSGKGRLVIGENAKADAASGPIKAKITDIHYTVKNLAKYTYYVQQIVGGSPRSYYYDYFNPANANDQSEYDDEIDYASAATIVAPLASAPGPFIFIPENNSSNIERGQSSYFAMKVHYEPGVVVKSVVWDELGHKIDYTRDALGNIGALGTEGALDYLYTNKDIKSGGNTIVASGVFFKNIDLLLKAIWHEMNAKTDTWTGDAAQIAAAQAVLTTNTVGGVVPYYSYKNATSWYRIDLGVGTGTDTDYGVIRGNAYTATVSAINGPGLPDEKDLTEEPGNPVKSSTYISVGIIAAKWTPVGWTGSVE